MRSHDERVQADERDIRVIENDAEIPFCITGLNSTWAIVMFGINLTAACMHTKLGFLF